MTTPFDIPLQPVSQEIYKKKYQLRDKTGVELESDVEDTFRRVAKALAAVEETDEKQREWFDKFLWAMKNGAIPAGRILSNAGAEQYKPNTTLINCVVSANIHDSMDDILRCVKEAGLTLKTGAGIGYCFSSLRPRGAYIAGCGANTAGPLPFMDIYDKMCFSVSSAGGRRGAQMATFDIRHPDVIELIKAKQEHGRFRQFNISLLISDDFLEAVDKKQQWALSFPIRKSELDLVPEELRYWDAWPIKDSEYIYDKSGRVLLKVYSYVDAKWLWDLIMESTYDYGEPGVIFIDRVNQTNNNWFCEDIIASNPCSEQVLPPYGCCLLGSVNLAHFVQNPFSSRAVFDFEKFNKVVSIFTRLLDNVIEVNGLPLEEQRQEILRKRRHGMGVTGLGSAIQMLGFRYGSPESVSFTDKVCFELAFTNYRVGLELAKEKGPAPIMNEYFEAHGKTGKELWVESPFVQRLIGVAWEKDCPNLESDFREYGCRFTHATSIAPTGTISLSIGNNVSSGCEPDFSHYYIRNVITDGRKTKKKMDVFSFTLLAFRHFVHGGALPEDLPDHCVTTNDISVKEHIDIQAAAQVWIDSSVSKTINCPTSMSFEDFKDVYRYGYEKGLKGLTTYRYSEKAVGAVLVRTDDLSKERYRFTCEDGTEITARGDEDILYEGEVHNVRNLAEAIREGYYGRL